MALLAIALALALAGCGGILPDRRPAVDLRTGNDVGAAIEAIPGVAQAQVMSGPDGLPGQNEIGVLVILQPDRAPTDSVLLDYALRQLWSQNKTHITTTVSVRFLTGMETEAKSVDLIPALTALGFTGFDHDPSTIAYLGYKLGAAEMTDHYGRWPGPVPGLPAPLATHSAPSAP
jgi:hypothetical protein